MTGKATLLPKYRLALRQAQGEAPCFDWNFLILSLTKDGERTETVRA
jgi:hypothetical protein